MAVLIVQLVTTVLARWFVPWRDSARLGMAAMFLFTGAAHFSSVKHDMAAMMPPPLTGALWMVYLTGVFEIAGAIGLLVPRYRRLAAWCLLALLIAMFPANVYAARAGLMLNGAPATALWLRTPLQVFWIAVLFWIARR